MRLIIVPDDGLVSIDNASKLNLTLSGIPANVHALQWFDGDTGEIEFKDDTPNETIKSLPSWASTIADEQKAAFDKEIADEKKSQEDYDAWAASDTGLAVLNREKRDILLTRCDWTQGADVPDSIKSKWVTYRQSLRDITTHSNWPKLSDSDWPTEPS